MSLLRRFAPPLATAAIVVVLGLLLALMLYRQQERELVASAEAGLNLVAQQVSGSFDDLFEPAIAFASTVNDARLNETAGAETARLLFALAGNPLRRLPQVNGIYLGFPDGSFMQMQQFVPAPVSDATAGLINPAMGTRRLVLPRVDGSMDDRWFYYDRTAPAGDEWRKASVMPPPYDPRLRPWYLQALVSDLPIWTDPYIFASTGKLGVTYATKILKSDGELWAVLGIDLSIEALSRILLQQEGRHAGFDGLVFATDHTGSMMAHPDVAGVMDRPDLDLRGFLQRYQHPSNFERQIIAAVQRAGPVYRLQSEGADYIVTRTDPRGKNAMPMQLYLAQNLQSVTAAARQTLERNIIYLMIGAVVLGAIIAYAVKLSFEVGARKRAETELIGARDLAEAATRAKSDFLATMSHEIRTPMNGVMSMAEMLELTRLDADQHRMAKVIRESAGALLTVINDILDFSKIEAGKLDIEGIPFSLGDLVDGVGELLATRADDRGLDLVIEIDPALPDRRIGDPTRLRQVLLNLGGNAIKFTEQGHVHIAVRRSDASTTEDTTLRFEVRDSGIGLTEDQCARLFRPFVQADSSTARKFGGTGLGLSICHRLCEMMGGRIGVTSVFGQGSVFWFELPLAPEQPSSLPPAPGAEIAEGIRAKRLLLVGLPAPATHVATRYLEAGGMTVAGSVADLETAETVDKNSYDIALVDARSSGNIVRDSAERLDAAVPRILLAARSLVSTLDSVARASFRATLTYPLNRSALWRAAAVACGLAPADTGHETLREDMAFAPPEADEAAAKRALILVAEDNPTNQMVIRQMLSRMGFACEIAKDGAVALRLYDAARERYGLLLTDFHMPEMDGFALTAAVRERERTHGERLPIIALTADALSGTEEKCLEAGMDGYLTKPIDSRRLGLMLAQWLPQALPLRRAAAATAVQAMPAAPEAPSWDRDIFDPARLAESFGSFDATAKQFLQDFTADAGTRVARILTLQDGSDMTALRHEAHALKGGALTVGATRLGNLAADLQDACDTGDIDTAQLMAELLPPTLDELKAALPLILKA